ncbi:MAG: hypothetical protein HUU37_02675 [Bdellovibrionales bacterium]|nr:hypothetical protein [Bdellovibrionales bacterium]
MEGTARRFSRILIPVIAAVAVWPAAARAAVVELSLMGQWAKTRVESYSFDQRRYSGSVEFKFSQVSGIQFEYTDSHQEARYRTNVGTLLPYYTDEVITYRDKVYSFNFVQNLVPAKWLIQPYIKFGGGRMDRTYTRSYPEFRLQESVSQRVTTGVGGAGIRIFLLRSLAVKGEFNTYVPDFRFSRWKENEVFSTGVSWLF